MLHDVDVDVELRNDPLEKLPLSRRCRPDERTTKRVEGTAIQRNSVDKSLNDPTAARPLSVGHSVRPQPAGLVPPCGPSLERRDGGGRSDGKTVKGANNRATTTMVTAATVLNVLLLQQL